MTSKPSTKVTRVKRRRRRSGEVAQRAIAIRNHCLECCGYDAGEVRRCTSPRCWLWPHRMGYGQPEVAET